MRVSSTFAVLLGLSLMLATSQSLAQSPPPSPVLISSTQPQCSDGVDNDGDGFIDYLPNILDHGTGNKGDDGCWDPADDLEAAGLPAGTVLTRAGECASSTLSIAGNTYDNCDWTGSITLAAANITIKNSHVGGRINCQPNTCNTMTIEDTDFDNSSGSAADLTPNSNQGGTYRRVRVRRYSQAWYVSTTVTVEDSVAKDTFSPSSGCHMETALIHGTGYFTMRRTRLSANWTSDSVCRGFTAVVFMPTWNDAGPQNKRFENVRFEKGQGQESPAYCVYGGGSHTQSQNMHIINSSWSNSCSPGLVTDWRRGRPNSSWSGNVIGDSLASGRAFPEP